MRLARRAALLVAFSLLTSAAAASAECAWMLWYELNSFGLAPGQNWTTPTHWAFVGGYQPRRVSEAGSAQDRNVVDARCANCWPETDSKNLRQRNYEALGSGRWKQCRNHYNPLCVPPRYH
jgi:hypothetical protein